MGCAPTAKRINSTPSTMRTSTARNLKETPVVTPINTPAITPIVTPMVPPPLPMMHSVAPSMNSMVGLDNSQVGNFLSASRIASSSIDQTTRQNTFLNSLPVNQTVLRTSNVSFMQQGESMQPPMPPLSPRNINGSMIPFGHFPMTTSVGPPPELTPMHPPQMQMLPVQIPPPQMPPMSPRAPQIMNIQVMKKSGLVPVNEQVMMEVMRETAINDENFQEIYVERMDFGARAK